MKALKVLALSLPLGLMGVGPLIAIRSPELTVCPQGPPSCDFASIQEALKAAPEGATIRILEGTYTENLVIQKSLKLVGVGSEQTTVKGAEAGRPVIRIESDRAIEVLIEGLGVAEAQFDKDKHCFDATRLICPVGIQVFGKVKATISNADISRNGYGIMVWDSARAHLVKARISSNKLAGILVGISAQAFISDSKVLPNNSRGGNIEVLHSARLVVSSSEVLGTEFGIELADAAWASITHTKISYSIVGIVTQQSARLEIRASEIWQNINGVVVSSQSQAVIFDSLIANNGGRGVLVADESTTKLQGSRILYNGDWGIAAWLRKCGFEQDHFTGQVELKDNEIRDNGFSGGRNICLP